MNSMFLISFNSTHHAIRFEKILKENNIKIRTIPTPREITSSCGLSITFENNNLSDIKSKIEEFKVDYFGVFKIEKFENGEKSVSKLC